jgi:hypothetical protein
MSAVVTPELEAFQKAWAEHVEMENRRGPADPHPYVYASSRRKCLRRMVYECTEPAAFPDFDTEAKARLARGNQRERDIVIDLMRVGRLCIPKFDFIGQQERVRIVDRKGRLIISGKIDGYIQWESGAIWPTELKSWSPFLTDKIFSFADLYTNVWTWSGAHQLLSYLYEKNAPYGLLVLDRPGLPRAIQVSLEDNLSQMEEFLRDATIVVDHIEAKTLPDFHDDPTECKRCPVFGSHCNPPFKFDGADIITDEDTIQKAERYAELQTAVDAAGLEEFEKLDKWAKERFRGIKQAIVGKCLVTGHWQKDTKYELTDDAKKQIDAIKKPFAKKVEEGKYFLTVSKVG